MTEKPNTRKVKFTTAVSTMALIGSLMLVGCDDSKNSNTPPIERLVEQAQAYVDQGQYRAAIIESRNAIQQAPQDINGYVLLAGIYNKLGSGKQSIELLEQYQGKQSSEYILTLAEAYLIRGKFKSALTLLLENPASAEGTSSQYSLLKARAHTGMLQTAQAESIYLELLQKDPSNIEALLRLAEQDILSKDFESANSKLERTVTIDPENARALLFRARIAADSGELEKTEAYLTQAVSALPNTDVITPLKANTLQSLATVLTRLGRSAEALVYTKLLAEANPDAAELKKEFENAVALFKAQKLDEAEDSLLAITSRYPGHEMSGQLLGIINFLQGDTKTAEKYFSESLDPEIASPEARHIMAMNTLRLNQPDEVLQLLSDDVSVSNNITTLSLYGVAALSAGRTEEGIEAITKALRIDPAQSRLRLILARFYNSRSVPNREEALKELISAYKHHKHDSVTAAALTQQYLIMNQPAKAEATVVEFIENNREDKAAYQLAGAFYASTQNSAKAREYLNRVLAIDEDSTEALKLLAQLALQSKSWDEAEKYSTRIAKTSPASPYGYRTVLRLFHLKGDAQKGIEAVNALVPSDNQHVVKMVLADYFASLNNYDQAATEVSNINESGLSEEEKELVRDLKASIAYRKGSYELKREDYDNARVSVFEVLTYFPENLKALSLLTAIEIQSARYSEVIKLIEQVEEISQAKADELKGDAARAQKDFEGAINHYQKAWLEQSSDLIARKLYELQVNLGRVEQGNRLLTDWLAAYPNSVAALTFSSNDNIRQGDYEAARDKLEKVASSYPNSVVHINNLAWVYYLLEDSRALETAERAYKIDSNNPNVLDTYGVILVAVDKREEGIEQLKRAAQLAPENSEIADHLQSAMQR